ncbi:NAD(P)-binding Rossmann-fold superfamily protein [Artemisia annua]|uniref:NAD(P)-binding Rossmann-fold superfamily protein n=1 Tax=Artemisia annua TaxID=35608 RepID=A0A2U1KCN4_ARTAN|nr:NAD(P)-binding Rossmann-fold superfamily protein [Artemisia annua]
MKLNLLNTRPKLITSLINLRSSSSSFSTFVSSSKPEVAVSLVQGASRGIGLEFVKQLLERNSQEHVIATCRNPDGAAGLNELKNKFSERLHIQRLDLTIESTIEDSARAIRERYGYLNLLVNASGILSIPGVIQPETTLSKVERSSLLLAYEINAVGPILVIKVCSSSSVMLCALTCLFQCSIYVFHINE